MRMLDIKPWDDKDRKIFRIVLKDTKAYTKNIEIAQKFGRRYPQLFDGDPPFMDIARINKRHETIFALRPNVSMVPFNKKFRFYKIF